MSKQNLKPFSWYIWLTQNCQKPIRNEKVKASKVERVKNSKNKPQNITKAIPEHLENYLYVALLLLKFQKDL